MPIAHDGIYPYDDDDWPDDDYYRELEEDYIYRSITSDENNPFVDHTNKPYIINHRKGCVIDDYGRCACMPF